MIDLREYRMLYTLQGYVNEIDSILASPGYSGLPDEACRIADTATRTTSH